MVLIENEASFLSANDACKYLGYLGYNKMTQTQKQLGCKDGGRGN